MLQIFNQISSHPGHRPVPQPEPSPPQIKHPQIPIPPLHCVIIPSSPSNPTQSAAASPSINQQTNNNNSVRASNRRRKRRGRDKQKPLGSMSAPAQAQGQQDQEQQPWNQEPSANPTGSAPEPDITSSSPFLSEAEVAQVKSEIAEALGVGEYSGASLYYDASTMASLNAFSLAAINRLRVYRPPPFPLWDALPVRKRAAILVLLFADRWGDLRVVITMRAASLRSFSGHAALPGGKADSRDETPYQIARREAFEEIGLPMDDARIPKPFRIEQLCYLPPSLARTHLVVTPCVAFLHADRTSPDSPPALVEDSMIPRLDAREVAAVFSAPFYNFLKATDLPPRPGETLPPGHWYDGAWTNYKGEQWRVHNFYVPVNNQRVSRPRRGSAAQIELADQLEVSQDHEGRFKVWGLTGRVLVDAARIAYDEEPEMEHNLDFGDLKVIRVAQEEGALDESHENSYPVKKDEEKPAKI